MASEGAIAAMNDAAMKKLERAMADIGGSLDVAGVQLPVYRDKRYEQAARLGVLADWAESVARSLGVSTFVEEVPRREEATQAAPQTQEQGEVEQVTERIDYESLTVNQLRELADARQVDLTGLSKKAEIIDALTLADDEDSE
jgi:hypothetical protein